MKKKSLKLRWPYFFGRRIHDTDSSGNMPDLIKPESEVRMAKQRAESATADILRWADDGGQMFEIPTRQIQPGNGSETEQQK